MQPEQPKDKAGNILSVGDKLVPINSLSPEAEDKDRYAGTNFEIIGVDTEMRTITLRLPIIKFRFQSCSGTAPDPQTEPEYHTRAMTYDSILECGRIKEGTQLEPADAAKLNETSTVATEDKPDYYVLFCICGNRFSHLTHLSKVHCPDCGREDPVDGGNNYFRIISL